jgi:hypothetical protein
MLGTIVSLVLSCRVAVVFVFTLISVLTTNIE